MTRDLLEEMTTFMDKKKRLKKEHEEWKRKKALKEAKQKKKELKEQKSNEYDLKSITSKDLKKKHKKNYVKKEKIKPLIDEVDWNRVKKLRNKNTSWKKIASILGISQHKLYRRAKEKKIK